MHKSVSFNVEDKVAFKAGLTEVKATGEVDIELEFVNWRRKSMILPNNFTVIEEQSELMTTPPQWT